MAQGVELSPQRYLADTVAGAEATRDFGATLDSFGPRPTADQTRAAAPALDEALARAELVAQRLAGARLADTRLEAQRAAAAAEYAAVVTAMRQVVAEAEAGRPVRLAAAAAGYQSAVDALRRRLGTAPTA